MRISLYVYLGTLFLINYLWAQEGSLTIIKLSPDEWKTYKDLRLRSLQEYPEAFGGSYEEEVCYPDNQWKNYLQDSLRPDGTVFLFARLDNKVVGMAGARIKKTLKNHHSATIFSVYVAPEARNRKIASRLLETILEELKNRSIVKANLIVNVQQKAAFKLYRRMGFHVVGFLEQEFCVDGQFQDFYLMTKFVCG